MDFKTFAVGTALAAGQQILKRHYGRLHTLTWKEINNFKNEVDDESDRFIRQAIEREFPDHRILSEEMVPKETGSLFTWVVDPLDGTLPYTTGISDVFSVCIGLCDGLTPIVGVIFCPKRDELYVAERGQGATLNGQPIGVTAESKITHVLMGMDCGKPDRMELDRRCARLLVNDGIVAHLKHGCASVPLCLVASGRLHAYAALRLLPWDMAAAVVINRAAGARVTDIEGKEWKLGDSSILSANPELHAKILERIDP